MAKIMVVDDAAFMRMFMKDILETAGHEVVCEASNGREAIEKYATFRPDLVTMDITMPDMDGIAALKLIMERDPAAQIIMCSAMGHREMILEAIRSGAKDFVVKPLLGSRVLDAVDRLLEV
ncbi:response regulator [Paenibacillus ehimensis]|uniref:Response regulator n=1 Tax=Paenibacillus ehimensis TaxID=79264 RepID=A0ABT8VFZ7_9BACL|nr:response regulator [Paenibacillus ehimensis]MDO3679888.1 response regulator [Paenibacillus ehimensis]